MDDQRFDALARALSACTSRRQVLRLLVVGAVAGWQSRSRMAAATPLDCTGLDPLSITCAGFGQTCCPNSDLLAVGYCADTSSDPGNCGGCGNVCGLTCCNGECVDLSGHLNNCGACGSVCTGACCNGQCYDALSDPNNCGGCGIVCDAEIGASCSNAVCVRKVAVGRIRVPLGCDSGYTRCADVCVDLNSDPANCGSCGAPCPPGTSCSGGACPPLACDAGLTSCQYVADIPGFACFDLATDPFNCGACDVYCDGVCSGGTCADAQLAAACDPGLTACVIEVGILAGQTECFDLSSNDRHCGACNNFCESGECSGGTCAGEAPTEACDPGLTDCNGTCVDLSSDPNECGACGNVCPSGQCAGGTCAGREPEPEGCDAGLTDCGVCVDLTSDEANCGSCGFICALNASCTNGECLCPDGWDYCEAVGACYDVASDANNCGGCGIVCGAGTACRDRACKEGAPDPTPEPVPEPTARPKRTPTTEATDALLGWPFDPSEGRWTIVNGYRGNRLHAAETDDGPNPSRFAFDFARCLDSGIDDARGICTRGGGDDGLFGQGDIGDILGEDGDEEILGPDDGATGWDRQATRGATVLAPVSGRIAYTGERTPTCRYVGIDVADHPGYQILLVNVDGAPTEGEVKRGEPIGKVATGSCGDGDAGDYLLMLLFRRMNGDEPDPNAAPEGLPFAGDWAIAGCAYPDDKKTANQYRGQLAPCRADDDESGS